MSVVSGKEGIVNGKSTVRDFSLTSSNDIKQGIASNTAGAPVVVAGNRDWSGQYNAYGALPSSLPGDALTFVGKTGGATWYDGPAIVDACGIVIDVENGNIIEHSVSFASNGALVMNSAVAATDSSDADMPSSVGTKFETSPAVAVDPVVFTEMADVRVMTINLTRDNPSYVSSSTAGETKRSAGNYGATIAVSVYQADPSLLPVVGTHHKLRVYTNATEFWLFEYATVSGLSDIQINRETGEFIGCTINYSMNAGGPFTLTSLAFVLGKITKPGGGNWWN